MAKDPGSPGHDKLGAEGILREIQINLLECKVCFEKFDSRQRGRRPQNLSCGHVLCVECTTALSHPRLRKLECPFCRQLCSADGTSHCQVLVDLQDLLLSWHPNSPAPPSGAKARQDPCEGLARAGLRFRSAFGGWGTLVNPSGVAALGSFGTVVVVHDGEKRVKIFSPQGEELHSFGQKEEICYAVDVAVTPCGYVVVTDAGGEAVKVFTSRGHHVLTLTDHFRMPWGVDTDSHGHLLVSDTRTGTVSRVKVDYGRGVVLEHRPVVWDLQSPRAVACCRQTGNTAVMEHLEKPAHQTGGRQHTRLTVFTKDFQHLYQADSLSLSLQSSVRLNMSAVAFSADGDVIVIDSRDGMVWSLGTLQSGPALTPLVGDHLIRPLGLVSQSDTLFILDGGDHTMKVYSAKSD